MTGHYLNNQERKQLAMHLRSAQHSWEYRRILALLVVDKVDNVSQVARLLDIGRSNIYRWLRLLKENRSVSALHDKRNRSGRPKRYTQSSLDFLKEAMKTTPQDHGYIETGWNVPLLRDYLDQQTGIQVSESTMRRMLHAINGRWARFGYEFDPDPEIEKKTPYQTYNQGVG
jgi:transposase